MIDFVIHSEISKTRMYSNEIAEKFTMTDSLLLILISIIPNPSNNNYYNIIYNYDNYNNNNYTQCVNPTVLLVAINKNIDCKKYEMAMVHSIMVPSMVPYYYMQMQQRIKHENEFNWHMKVKERQGVEEKLTDRENGI